MSVGTITYPAPGQKWPRDVRGESARVMFNYAGPPAAGGGYVTGGDPITAGQIKLGTIEYMDQAFGLDVAGVNVVLFRYNQVTSKIQAFWFNGAAAGVAPFLEVAGGTDLSGYSTLMVAEGRG